MAKQKMKMSMSVPTLGGLSAKAQKDEDEWRTRDDADKVKRYAELRQDGDRHKKALDHIRNEHASMMDILGDDMMPRRKGRKGSMQPRSLARSGRKRGYKVPRKTGRR